MPSNLTYILIDIGAFIIPFLFSFHPRVKFKTQWNAFLPANLIIAVCFIIWDMIYTKIGVWGFNDKYILGLKIYNLPIEEVLFFILIPYSSTFTYYCFSLFFPPNKLSGKISLLLIVILTLTGLVFIQRLYTSVTFISLAILIFYLTYVTKPKWLSHFYLTYAVILIPFFIVNGLLTGTGPGEPVVWYNDNENLRIRILTIPVEDIFYGMLLLLLNTTLFEKFRIRNA